MNSLGMYIASAVQTHSSGRLPSHQLSNWESDGDVKAARIAPRLALGTPLRPNQNTIAFTARNDTHRPTLIHTFSPVTSGCRQTPDYLFIGSTNIIR